ncbi:hypothetical protein KBC75_01605 [Candidatus Shapirobacteria bacterium]|nr:hypothetical protein [Candidatus Shapirobacteria bacterium]
MDFNLTISPAQAEYLVKPGATIIQAYTATNNSQNNLILKTSVEPWVPKGTDGSVDYQNATANSDLQFSLGNSDLQLGQNFTLKPGEKRQLVLKIKSNPNSEPIDSYYTFFLTQDQSGSLGGSDNQALAQAKIGSHLLLSYSPTENYPETATVSQLNVFPGLIDTFFPKINISGEITNTSTHFFKTDGKITVTKGGATIKELKLFPHNILAQNSRSINCLQDKDTQIDCTLSPPYWPGLYTATLELNSPIKSTPLSINFYVFPYTVVASIIFLTSIGYLLLRKKSIKKQLSSS